MFHRDNGEIEVIVAKESENLHASTENVEVIYDEEAVEETRNSENYTRAVKRVLELHTQPNEHTTKTQIHALAYEKNTAQSKFKDKSSKQVFTQLNEPQIRYRGTTKTSCSNVDIQGPHKWNVVVHACGCMPKFP